MKSSSQDFDVVEVMGVKANGLVMMVISSAVSGPDGSLNPHRRESRYVLIWERQMCDRWLVPEEGDILGERTTGEDLVGFFPRNPVVSDEHRRRIFK